LQKISAPRPIKIALCKHPIKFFKGELHNPLIYMVGVTGIEPATPASRRRFKLILNAFPCISIVKILIIFMVLYLFLMHCHLSSCYTLQ